MNISHRASADVSATAKPVKVAPLSCYCKLDDLIPKVKQLTQPAPTPPHNPATKTAA
jgi:hypothetical protein